MLRPIITLLAALALVLGLPGIANADQPPTTIGQMPTPVTGEDVAPAPADEPPAPEVAEEEEADPTLADHLAGFGIELSETEAAAVAAYDAAMAAGTDYTWPVYQNEDGDDVSIGDDIIGYVSDHFADTGWRVDNLWILIAAFLVFMMHLGFATLESGLTQAKNTTNILFKNTMIPCIGLLLYAAVGFNMMYPVGNWFIEGWIANPVPGIHVDLTDPLTYVLNATAEYAGYTWYTDFLFQGMFAATAATIVSGCVAERVKLGPFLIFSAIFVGIIYPIAGSWKWGGGSLGEAGFIDFAGSTLVHSVGGWGGLAGILIIGARRGKYVDGQIRPIMPSNMPLATIGVFLLWFGWFGFNGGSQLNADPAAISYICTTTAIAAAMGGLAAAFTSWIVGKKPDQSMALNGILAGLVGITANCDIASLMGAAWIGLIAGVLVYFAVITFDKLRIDDPVGALSVHLVCGIWGTLACGIPFLMKDGAAGSFLIQLYGVFIYAIIVFPLALILWIALKAITGVRVSAEEEEEGLDVGEHGMSAYHGLEAR